MVAQLESRGQASKLRDSSSASRPASPALCTITRKAGHGGIARVSALLWKALQEEQDRCRLLELIRGGRDAATRLDKLLLARELLSLQLRRRLSWILFDHLWVSAVQQLVPARFRRPYGVFLYSMEAWQPLSRVREAALLGASVRIAISHYTAERIAAAHPGAGRIHVCHLALSPDATVEPPVPEVEQGLVARVGAHAVLVVGRMARSEAYKGHEQLIAAWPEVVGHVPDAQLVIVGGGDDVDRLRGLARGSGTDASILFTGRVSDATVDALYRRAAVFAMPSRGEGFGIVYLEAMRHALPCIGSFHDAAREIVVDGETGLLVDQAAIPELSAALRRLLQDGELRRRLGRAGQRRLQQHFSYEQFKRSLETALAPLRVS
jgi:phosphatidylinositol alpha-1,6-mannosyltransferase